MPLKALLEGCLGHTPCIQCHGKKKAFHKFLLGRLPCCLCGWQQPSEIHKSKMSYSSSREHYILWNPVISTYAPSSVVPGSSKDSMPPQSWSTIKLLGRLFSERSRQEKGFPSICSEWLVSPWLCHAWAALHCRLLPAARLPRLCFAALWVCALSHTYFWAFNQRPPSHWNFLWSESSLPWLHVSASSDCSLRQGYTSQPDQLQGTDKFGTDRMAGWPWLPASMRWTMGWVWAVSGLAESSELKPGHCQLCRGWELIQCRHWENKHFPFTESSCQCNSFLRAALVPCLGSCQELGGGRWPIYSSS